MGLCALDAGGHGVAAALLAVTAGQLLARLCGVPPAPPGEVVRRMSEQVSAQAAGQCITLLYGVLDLPTGAFRFVSAGHPGPAHVPRGARAALREAAGLPVGVGRAGYPEEVVRQLSAEALGKVKPKVAKKAVLALRGALKDRSPLVRLAAAESLWTADP